MGNHFNPKEGWSMSTKLVLAFGVVALSGCVSFPIVKKEAFDPAPKKVAIVVYDAEPAAGPLGMPVKVKEKELSDQYDLFREKLGNNKHVQFVDDALLTKAPIYYQLPTPPVDMGVSAAKLRRVQLVDSAKIAELAKALEADVIVAVNSLPKVTPKTQVMGIGTSVVTLRTQLHAFGPDGQEIWRDQLDNESDSFAVARGGMDAQAVEKGTVQCMKQAAGQLVARLEEKIGQ
jgi:hypothetical protein